MPARPPTEKEQEILQLFAGVSEANPVMRGTLLLLEITEKREHVDAISACLPDGVTRDYLAGRDAALIFFRERLEKLVKLANPPPDQA